MERGKEREREKTYMVAHSPTVHNRWGWARSNPGARLWICQVVAGSQLLELPPRAYTIRKLQPRWHAPGPRSNLTTVKLLSCKVK